VRPSKRRILIVDDNRDAVEMLRIALEQLGSIVDVALDGPSALAHAATFDPDVALLDIGLPVMDGYELARHLREKPGAGDGLRLIAITGYGHEADQQRSREAGFEQHLVKPVDIECLERVIEKGLVSKS
jgi:CheY-like chemotaxis protein